ncbi:MAG: hypothetical protein ACYTFQ_28140, partial [Planctomycetota bacterium]
RSFRSGDYKGTQTGTSYDPGPLNSSMTYYWRIDATNSSGTTTGDVWSFTVRQPLEAAYDPTPADGAAYVENNLLEWNPASAAVKHDVYFGTAFDDVNDASPAGPLNVLVSQGQTDTTYDAGVLDIGQTYYWRVDEVSGPPDFTVFKGAVWTFSSTFFPIAVVSEVDNGFEDYGNDPSRGDKIIFDDWSDGFDDADNGAQIGYPNSPDTNFLEMGIVHGGKHSLPYSYNGFSLATREYDVAEDWTQGEPTVFSLWFRGYPPSVGSFTENTNGMVTMTGSGVDIWNVADEFHFAYKTLSGPGSIVARVNRVQNTNGWAKAGVMIRETLDPGSRHAFACVTPANGVAFQGRLRTDDTSFNTNEGGIAAPHWVKLERGPTGIFTVYHSPDNGSWEPVQDAAPQNIPMHTNVYVGLALTAHNADATCEAVFSDVTTTGAVSPWWWHGDVGILSNDPEPMSMAITDTTGASAIVYHPDAAATQRQGWTRWQIDLKQFADLGVNLAAVSSYSIGIGNPIRLASRGDVGLFDIGSSGGSGTLLLDDLVLKRGAGSKDLTLEGSVWKLLDGKPIGNATVNVEGFVPGISNQSGFYWLGMGGVNPNVDYVITVSAAGFIDDHPDVLVDSLSIKRNFVLKPDVPALPGLPRLPLYRFRSSESSQYFYTLDKYTSEFDKHSELANIPREMDALLSDPGEWIYEGIAFYTENSQSELVTTDVAVPVYRFKKDGSDIPAYARDIGELTNGGPWLPWSDPDEAFYVFPVVLVNGRLEPVEGTPASAKPVRRYWDEDRQCYYFSFTDIWSGDIIWYAFEP